MPPFGYASSRKQSCGRFEQRNAFRSGQCTALFGVFCTLLSRLACRVVFVFVAQEAKIIFTTGSAGRVDLVSSGGGARVVQLASYPHSLRHSLHSGSLFHDGGQLGATRLYRSISALKLLCQQHYLHQKPLKLAMIQTWITHETSN